MPNTPNRITINNVNQQQVNHQYNQVKISAINVNSLIKNTRRIELLNFINENKLDFVLISETKLNKKHNMEWKNYNMTRTDRPNNKAGGGTAILSHNKWEIKKISYPSSYENKILEFTITQLTNTQFQGKIFIISVYAKPNDQTLFIEELQKLFTQLELNKQNNYFIIAGDINARHKNWNDSSNNMRGRFLTRWLDSNSINFKINFITASNPTFKPAQSYLDVCLIDSRLSITNTVNNKLKTIEYDSDHDAILFTVKLTPELSNQFYQPRKKYIYQYKRTNWDKFNKKLLNKLPNRIPDNRNLFNDEIDLHLNNISEAIIGTVKEVVPTRQSINSTSKYTTLAIKKLMKLKKQQQKNLKWCLTTDPRAKKNTPKQVKQIIYLINQELKTEDHKAYTNYWKKQMNSVNYRDSNKFFPKINKIRRINNTHSKEISNLLVNDSENQLLQRSNVNINKTTKINNQFLITDNVDKLNVMGAYYEQINSPRHLDTAPRLKELVIRRADEIKQDWENKKNNTHPFTNFSPNNSSINPNINPQIPKYLCEILQVAKIFHNLPSGSEIT